MAMSSSGSIKARSQDPSTPLPDFPSAMFKDKVGIQGVALTWSDTLASREWGEKGSKKDVDGLCTQNYLKMLKVNSATTTLYTFQAACYFSFHAGYLQPNTTILPKYNQRQISVWLYTTQSNRLLNSMIELKVLKMAWLIALSWKKNSANVEVHEMCMNRITYSCPITENFKVSHCSR